MNGIFFILLLRTINSGHKSIQQSSHSQEHELKETLNLNLIELCFYSTDKTKCPSNIDQSSMFGPSKYDLYSSKVHSFSNNLVKIHIAEPIYLTKPIIFSSPSNFIIVGNQINGKIEIHEKASIDIQDPTNLEIKLYWSIHSKEISQIKTLLPAKSIYIQIIDQNENISSYQLPFYTGNKTTILLSTTFYKQNIQYLIKYDNYQYYAILQSYRSTLTNNNNNNNKIITKSSGSLGTNLKYNLNSNLTLLTIEGTGKMNDFNDLSSRPWHFCKDKIFSIIINDGVTSISNFAFSDLINLISITIPKTVTSIGKSCFCNCISLWDVKLPESIEFIGDRLFYNCSSLILCTVPQKVTQIPDYAFFNCTELVFVELHDKVTSIGNYSFYCCINLTDFTFSKEITTIPNYAFYNCSKLKSFEITEKVTSIGNFAFFGCSGLESIEIHEKVTFIGTGSFSNCHNFESFEISDNNTNYEFDSNCIISKSDNSLILYVNFEKQNFEFVVPEKVTSINGYAFYNQTYLTSITFPANIPTIDEYTFYNCISIIDLTIPNSVTSINQYAFYQCKSLKQLKLSENLESIGEYAFYECKSIDKFLFPPTLKTIGSHSFSFCNSLNNIEIDSNNQYFTIVNQGLYTSPALDLIYYSRDSPNVIYNVHNGCTKICSYSFSNVKNLKNLTMPDSVTIIDDFAFYNNNDIEFITLSNNLETIGKYSFCKCNRLRFNNFPDSINSIGEYSFYKASVVTLKIPDKASFIGEGAFCDTNLYTINFASSSYTKINKLTFSDLIYLNQVNITENIQFIHPKAFLKCEQVDSYNIIGTNSNFKSIDGVLYSSDGTHLLKYPSTKRVDRYGPVIEDTVTTIDEYACSYTLYFKTVDLPSSIIEIKEGAFYNSYMNKFRGNLQSVDKYAFGYCWLLTDIDLTTLKEVPEGLFYACSNLEKIDLGSSDITTIGDYSFTDCSRMKEIVFPKNVKIIGNYAFSECTSLVYINNVVSIDSSQTINNVSYIGEYAFYLCISLSLSFRCHCDYIGKYAFYRSGIEKIYINCSYIGMGAFQRTRITYVDFNCKDILIGKDLFSECVNISHLNFTSNNIIKAIPNHFCYNCESLKILNLPSSVNYIGKSAFENCIHLKNLIINSDLFYIAPLAISNCKSLINITYKGVHQPKYSNDSFLNSNAIQSVTVTSEYIESSFCGFTVWTDIKVDNENGTILKPPIYKPIYVDVIENQLNDNVYYFLMNNYQIPNHKEIIVLKLDYNKYKINHVVIDYQIANQAAILIPNEYPPHLTITGLNNTENYTVNIITAKKSLNLSFSYLVHPRFNNTKGDINIDCIDCINDSYYINIDLINPAEGSEPFTLIPSSSSKSTVYVETVNFDKNNTELIVVNDRVKIKNITVQQFVNAKISNCEVLNTIQFGIASSLFLNKTVYLDGCKLIIPFNKDRQNLYSTYIKGELVDYPRLIEINKAVENIYLLNKNDGDDVKKIFIAESDQHFYCNAWMYGITNKMSNSLDFNYFCTKEKVNDADVFRLYAQENNEKSKKKKKIGIELLVIIVASCVAFVVIVVSICLYCFVLKKKLKLSNIETP